jgi:hypothetical protein
MAPHTSIPAKCFAAFVEEENVCHSLRRQRLADRASKCVEHTEAKKYIVGAGKSAAQEPGTVLKGYFVSTRTRGIALGGGVAYQDNRDEHDWPAPNLVIHRHKDEGT